jgi:large conductance mechanosensitive channel
MVSERVRQPLEISLQKGSGLWNEFQAFALKSNFVDLAIAVVIGAATTGLINALVKDIVMPIVGYVAPTSGGYQNWKIGEILIGEFLAQLLNFFVQALVVFVVLVKLVGAIRKATQARHPEEPATKECPLCLSVIPYRARKCGHCTADLPVTT